MRPTCGEHVCSECTVELLHPILQAAHDSAPGRKADAPADTPLRPTLTLTGHWLASFVTAFGQDTYPLGRRTVKTEPLPSSLATLTSPPIRRASLRERARPRPVPP